MKYKPRYNMKPLIRARLRKRWTVERLAAEIGRTANMVYKVENGSRPSERTILKMSEVLKVSMKRILMDEKDHAA